MNQRLVIFIAIVCLAQLGVTVFQHVRNGTIVASSSFTKGATPTDTPINNPRSFVGDAMLARASLKSQHISNNNAKTVTDPVQLSVASKPIGTPSPVSSTTAPSGNRGNQDARDPFVPLFAIRKDSTGQGKDPLTQYDLSELRLTAVIRDDKGNYSASVETSQGRTFIVKKGAKIGKHGGIIRDISPSKISVSEDSADLSNQISSRTRDLTMKAPPTPLGMTVSPSQG